MKEHRIIRRWDDYLADWQYILQVKDESKSRWNDLYDGDEEWAERQARHYGCNIETDEK